MVIKKLLSIFLLLFALHADAQVKETADEVDAKSLQLYNQGNWEELIQYAKGKIQSGFGSSLLQMRLGYAYYMQGKYAHSLSQYQKAYDAEHDNQTALYYVYLNNLYLNNTNEARYYAAKLKRNEEKEFALSSIETEFSYKSTSFIRRKDAKYLRVGLNTLLGYKLELQQSLAMYNQVIDEPGMAPLGVTNFQNINIQQKEYYGKLIFAATGRLSLLAGYHYVYTPFNNLIYNNSILFGGLKYTTPFFRIKVIGSTASISKQNYNQFDVSVSAYPLGNTKLYTVSKAIFTSNNSIFTQVAGLAVAKKIWLEANATLGTYEIMLDNDALYVYNDIDKKKAKYGGSVYVFLSKKLTASFNYTYEEKSKYKVNNLIIKQHNFTGGLQWKF